MICNLWIPEHRTVVTVLLYKTTMIKVLGISRRRSKDTTSSWEVQHIVFHHVIFVHLLSSCYVHNMCTICHGKINPVPISSFCLSSMSIQAKVHCEQSNILCKLFKLKMSNQGQNFNIPNVKFPCVNCNCVDTISSQRKTQCFNGH